MVQLLKKKKVCMLVASHPFLDARIFKKEAVSLKNQGYDVTLIVPRINGYLFDVDGTPFRNEYRNKVFFHEDIKIVTYNNEQVLPYLNMVRKDPSVWGKEAYSNMLTQLAIKENADIYHVHEYMSLFAGFGVKQLLKQRGNKDVKLIYDSHELTPDPLDDKYTKPVREELHSRLMTMLKETDCIITVSEAIKSWYLTHIPSLYVEVVYNSPPLSLDWEPPKLHKTGITACYEGNINLNKGSKEKMFEMARLCKKQIDFELLIIGGSRYGEKLKIPGEIKDTVKPVGWVDYQKISENMKSADIGWIDFDKLDSSLNRRYAMPNKFFSYLNSGKPIVVNNCQEMAAFVKKYECGIVVSKEQATGSDFAEAIIQLEKNRPLLHKMGLNARKAMENYYSWEKAEKKLFEVYENLLSKKN